MQNPNLTEAFYFTQFKSLVKKTESFLFEEVEVHDALREMYVAAVEGGMRFRPVLQHIGFLLGGGKDVDSLVPYSASLELLHKASLVHDDLIDEDALRRGVPSFYSRFGSDAAIAMGDFLVAVSYQILLEQNLSHSLMEFFTATHNRLCLGELLEVAKVGKKVTLADTNAIILGKTASLLEYALVSGAMLAGADDRVIDALRQFGEKLGLVFQTINDLNNLSGFDKGLKGADLTDLEKKKFSIPLVILNDLVQENENCSLWEKLDSANSAERELLYNGLKQSAASGEIKAKVADFCRTEMEDAKKTLEVLPPSKMKEILQITGEEMFASWFWQVKERK